MTIEPILKAKLEKYQEDYLLNNLNEDELFERYVNSNILSQMQPGVFTTDYELLDLICVGGGNDLGIDGIAILVNGRFAKSRNDVDDILYGNRRGEIEIIFIQSKNKSKFDLGEYMKFTNGVEDFLQEKIIQPANEAVMNWHSIYNYIMSKEVIIKWSKNPTVRLYYAVAGTWEKTQHILKHSEVVKNRLLEKRCFDNIEISILDSKSLLDIINSNENNYKVVIDFVDSMPLPEVEQVDNSSVILCNASVIVDLLSTDDGLLRRGLFEDNVRDYQGETVINTEIRETLRENPQRFVLLNNGITIVCDEVQEGNRKISITNPQIVNGCQTCNVLFQCQRDGINIENAFVIIKVIGSADQEIVNNIVKGTNRQNIVYEEAFEITKEFHKLLEQFFNVMEVGQFEKIFYERRSKQFDNNPLIKPYQRVSFRILIQSFVSVFMYKVDEGHRHESKLLHDYGNKIFVDNQSFYPYYTAAYIYTHVERLFRNGKLDRILYTYKYHIMLLIKELQMGRSPSINSKKEIEKYCKDLLKKLDTTEKLVKYAQEACEKFNSIKEKWVSCKGESYRYAIKDKPEFTEFLLAELEENKNTGIGDSKTLRGKVLNISTDRHGKYFGFIKKEPSNIFFHENKNPNVSLEYENKDVMYEVKLNDDGREYATNICLIQE